MFRSINEMVKGDLGEMYTGKQLIQRLTSAKCENTRTLQYQFARPFALSLHWPQWF